MSKGLRRALELLALLGLAAVMVVGYQRFVLDAPVGAFEWVIDEQKYQLLEPRALGYLLVVPILIWALGRSLADLPLPQRILSLLVRVAFLALLALGLAQLVRTAETQRVCTVFLVDVSDSVSSESLQEAQEYLRRAFVARRKDDEVRLVTFARRARLVSLEERDGELVVPTAAELRHEDQDSGQKASSGSNLEGALQLAYGLFPPGTIKHAVLLTDGVETEGNVLAEASRGRDLGVRLFTVPFRSPPPPEVAVRELRIPDKVQIGEPFEVVADVYASRGARGRARLYQGETLNGLEGIQEVDLKPGSNELRFRSVVQVGGEVTYQLKLDRLERDEFPENNRYAATLDVPGRPAVLYVEGQPQRATYLSAALTAQQFDVDVRSPSGFPGSLAELERYGFVIVSDVPREQMSVSSQELVASYVRDLGGGFLFAGGEAGFGLGGWAHTTIERILPVRMDAERRKDMPSVAMVLVIDRSGSMTGLPIEMAKAACKATVSTLQGSDLIEVIAFDSDPVRYVKMQPARYRTRIQNDILRIQPGGGTEIFPALDMAYQDISVVQARKKHVILLSDGRSPTQGIRDLVQAMIAENVTVTTVGLGDGADGELLRSIADAGGGRYHPVPDPNSLPRIFTRETEMVASQAAVEEWFPVQVVTPAPFLRGIAMGSAPLLHGYVATQMKGPPAQLILSDDRGEPILARWRVGLGTSLAWTSDVKNLWAVDWLRWPGFSKFWGQLVREHMRKKRQRELAMRTEVVGNQVRATVDAFTAGERFDNGMISELSVVGPEPGGKSRKLNFAQTAPGRYEARFTLDEYGSFLLRATHYRETPEGKRQQTAVSYGHISNPYPREYASFETDVERLRRVALAGGGAFDPQVSALFDPGESHVSYHEPLWSRFVLAAIVAFLLDLLLRRVRLFDRKFLKKRRKPRAGQARPSVPPPSGRHIGAAE